MTAIFTFSLDYGRDREIIDVLYSKKNRSDYIRTILRQDNMLNLYMEAFDSLYDVYRSAITVHAGREPLPKAHFLMQNKYQSSADNEASSRADNEECFTCKEIGKEHCNIHMNYDSAE